MDNDTMDVASEVSVETEDTPVEQEVEQDVEESEEEDTGSEEDTPPIM